MTKKRTAATQPTLDRDAVIEAAIAEIDARGLAAFSVRNLAARLGVYPTAVYWYVPSRNDILSEVVGAILGNAVPKGEMDWREYLRRLFARYRQAIKKHPNAAPLVGAHLIGNSRIPLRFVEALLQRLVEAGFAERELVHAYNTVIAALAGFLTQEFAATPEDDGEWRAGVEERLEQIDAADYPVLAANLPLLANHAFILRWQSGAEAPLDQSFERYVDVVLDGLEASAARIAPAASTRKRKIDRPR